MKNKWTLSLSVILLVLAYAGDTLSTVSGGVSALAADYNPLLHHFSWQDYIVFSLLRFLTALIILLLFWPAQLRLRGSFSSRSKWLLVLVPFAYERAGAYFGAAVVIAVSVIKIVAAIHNVVLVQSGRLLLPETVTISLSIVAGVLLSNGLLYAQHLAAGSGINEEPTRNWHEGVVLPGGRSATNRLRWLVLLLGASCGLFYTGTRGSGSVVASSVRVERPGHDPVRLQVYTPIRGSGMRMPGVIICPALNVSPSTFTQMAMETAKAGMVCAVVDFFGKQPDESRQHLSGSALETASGDLESAVAWLRSQPQVDRSKIGLVGHSFGASVILNSPAAVSLGRSTVLIGMAGDLSQDRPLNVLLLAGLYDEFYPSSRLLRSLETGTGGTKPVPETIYGDFKAGTARMLCLEPTASHVTEIHHPGVIGWAVRWLAMSFGRFETCIKVIPLGIGSLALWGALLLLIVAVVLVLSWNVPVFRVAGILALAGTVLWPCIDRTAAARIPTLLVLAIPFTVAGYVSIQNRGDSPVSRWLRMLEWNMLALYIAYCLTLIGGNLFNYGRYPGLALGIPVFIVINPLLQLLELVQQCLSVLQWYCGMLSLQVVGGLICLLELAHPGAILVTLETVGERVRALTATGRKTGSGWRSILILSILLVVLVLLGFRRFQEGFLTGEAAGTFGDVVLRSAIPVVAVFVILRRLPLFRRGITGAKVSSAPTP